MNCEFPRRLDGVDRLAPAVLASARLLAKGKGKRNVREMSATDIWAPFTDTLAKLNDEK